MSHYFGHCLATSNNVTQLYVLWFARYSFQRNIHHNLSSLIHTRSTDRRKKSPYSCQLTILREHGVRREKNGKRLYRDNTETPFIPEVSLWHWSCAKWHLCFYVVYVSAGILPPCPRIRPDSVRRCVAYRSSSGCHGHPLRRLTLRQKRRFLVVQIRQKEDLAFIRYRVYIYIYIA